MPNRIWHVRFRRRQGNMSYYNFVISTIRNELLMYHEERESIGKYAVVRGVDVMLPYGIPLRGNPHGEFTVASTFEKQLDYGRFWLMYMRFATRVLTEIRACKLLCNEFGLPTNIRDILVELLFRNYMQCKINATKLQEALCMTIKHGGPPSDAFY